MLTPREVHDACHTAMLECPQFRGWDDDTLMGDYGPFGEIPNHGMSYTISFWIEWGDTLWDSGYSQCLPDDVREMFR